MSPRLPSGRTDIVSYALVRLIDQPQTPLSEWYRVMGLACLVATNSPDVLAAARAVFREMMPPQPGADFTLRFWVDPAAHGSGQPSQARFRGLNHLVCAQFDDAGAMLLDLRRRRALGRFSPALAADAAYWQRVVLPNAVGLMSEALGLTALHCASVEKEGRGLLMAGGSGAGKSTLSLALARRGFAFLSDDWTYFSHANGRLRAWHIATPIKLLPDAVRFFPELSTLEPHVSLNGEVAYEADPEGVFGVRRSLECEPRWLVFVERRSEPGHCLVRLGPEEAAARLEHELEELPEELSAVSARQSGTVLELAGRECWSLAYGGSPDEAAEVLARFCAESTQHGEPRPAPNPGGPPRFRRAGPDILRRFTPTPLTADFDSDLETGGGAIRLQTNSAAILRHVSGTLRPAGAAPRHRFLWRLVADDESASDAGGGQLQTGGAARIPGWRADGLYFESTAEGSFLVVDTEARLAVGFFSPALVNDAAQFQRQVVVPLISGTGSRFVGSL